MAVYFLCPLLGSVLDFSTPGGVTAAGDEENDMAP